MVKIPSIRYLVVLSLIFGGGMLYIGAMMASVSDLPFRIFGAFVLGLYTSQFVQVVKGWHARYKYSALVDSMASLERIVKDMIRAGHEYVDINPDNRLVLYRSRSFHWIIAWLELEPDVVKLDGTRTSRATIRFYAHAKLVGRVHFHRIDVEGDLDGINEDIEMAIQDHDLRFKADTLPPTPMDLDRLVGMLRSVNHVKKTQND